MSDTGDKERSRYSEFPHHINIRITERMFQDLEYVKRVRKSSDSQIIRGALQPWLNQAIHKIMEEESAGKGSV